MMLIAMLGAMSLNFLTGCAGLISIGHAALYATGAMTAATAGTLWGWPFPWVLLAAACTGADLLWLESPTNPMLEVADLPACITAAHAAGARVLVDNTFATPVLQQPLALGADIRVMAQSAKLAASYAKRGVLPESGGTWYLPRMLGWARASELIFTGRTLSAAQSLELGLVNRVVPDGEVMGAARELAP